MPQRNRDASGRPRERRAANVDEMSYSRDAARELFWQAIERHVPDVWDSLKADVRPVWKASRKQHEGKTNEPASTLLSDKVLIELASRIAPLAAQFLVPGQRYVHDTETIRSQRRRMSKEAKLRLTLL